MRVRKLALAVGLVSALGGNTALALGLGEIKLNSTLNQPLDAEIGLLQTRGLGEGEIKVRLAAPDDFERAGVDRSYLLTSLKFDVDMSSGKPVVRISSREPIREPFLNFLVETRWPSGRLLREYTLLMDLPAFSGSTAQQPVRAAERERQQVRREAPPVPVQEAPRPAEQERVQVRDVEEESLQPAETQVEEQAAAEEPRTEESLNAEPVELRSRSQAASESAGGSQVYGPVASSDTLWEIALQNRAATGASVHQTMLAIQRLNPEAFIDNNINLLKKGAVLRLPNADDVSALTLSEAVSEVAVQNDAWRQRIGAVSEESEVTGAPLDARAASDDAAVSDTVEGRVSLAAPGDNESVTSGSGSGSEDSEALEGELAVTEEELDKSELENVELKERISELDEQIDTMERMVEVSNEELSAVQAAAEASDPATNPLEAGVDDSATDEAGEGVADEEPLAETTGEDALATEEEAEPQEDTSRNRVVVAQSQPKQSLLDQALDNIQYIGIGIGALLLAIVGFITWRRRKEEEEAMLQVEREMAAERALAEAPEVAEPDETLAAVESMEADENFDLGGLDNVGTDDPISEAEIHLSLSQYDEAEQKLLTGLQQDGQNVDARLMLMEVYAHRQDAGNFDEHYRQLLAISDGPAADRAARLRESIPGAPPFEMPDNFSSESLEATQLDDISASLEDDFSGFSADSFGSDNSGTGNSDFGADDFSTELESDLSTGLELKDDEFEGDTALLDDLTMDLADDSASAPESAQKEDDFSLDLDSSFDSDTLNSEPFDSDKQAEEQGADSEFNLDDLDLGDLDLGSDDGLESDGSAETRDDELSLDFDSGELSLDELPLDDTPAAEETASAEESSGGLEFDLDLSPMDDGAELELEEPSAQQEPSAEQGEPSAEQDEPLAQNEPSAKEELSSGESDLSLDDLDDLDSIGGELEGDLDLDSIDLDDIAGDLQADEELSLESDTAVAIEPESSPQRAAPSASTESRGEKASRGEADLSDLSFNLESDLDSELNLMEGSDEIGTKLELAQAYLDMGDKDGAKDILSEVAQEGSGEYRARAEEMLERLI